MRPAQAGWCGAQVRLERASRESGSPTELQPEKADGIRTRDRCVCSPGQSAFQPGNSTKHGNWQRLSKYVRVAEPETRKSKELPKQW
ncbi:hypothetical protein KTAU_38830 [Thermogemmatispora aurantia]|uniref:Uncharacterized protein n=1 Tax=Thermogemmatispora aurantia TaxID=2045279 RepID=A0A5J4K9I3_9CHLR|nr:hypothetical protein KTAU_38830 [Thermogemmatispora aurantia]